MSVYNNDTYTWQSLENLLCLLHVYRGVNRREDLGKGISFLFIPSSPSLSLLLSPLHSGLLWSLLSTDRCSN